MILINIALIAFLIITSIIIWFFVGYEWEEFSRFFHERYDYFDFSFIIIYFVEQLILFYLIYKKFDPQITAGIFSLIIITTAALQNKCWECKTKNITKLVIEQRNIISSLSENQKDILKDNRSLEMELKEYIELNDELFDELEKNINKRKKN